MKAAIIAAKDDNDSVGGIVPRIIPVIENMTALALYDAWSVQSRISPDWPDAL